eukprot:TRINITY_DN257_c0_g1_i1.p2 TRINITY_DN257_c0_g1~~TRINITY_DN257_c0_g1_i1.p2  ORF type:complete len:197 (-),score=47.74 TRINITY_DN257_c0_g1_i1:230-820(-)
MSSLAFLLGRAGSAAMLKTKPVSQIRSIGRVSQRVYALAVGDKLPAGSFDYFDSENNIKSISVDELCKGKKVVLFAVPGAFTPTCSMKHLPEFIDKSDEIKAGGVDTIACISVNDPFVMDAWAKSVGAGDKVMMLADGSGIFTKDLGVSLDLTDKGLGIRSRRYAMIVNDGAITKLNLEEAGAFTISGADQILAAL